MVMALKGAVKVNEECLELGVVTAKAMQVGGLDQPHWSGNLIEMAEDEMGDVLAAIQFAVERNGLNMDRILERKAMKYGLYVMWDSDPSFDKPSE